MEIVIGLLCVIGGLAIYFGVVCHLMVPLSRKIPTGKDYRATLAHTKK